MCCYNPLHRSRRFLNQYFRLTEQKSPCIHYDSAKRETVYSEHRHVLRGEKCTDASRMFAMKYLERRDLNTDVSVFD